MADKKIRKKWADLSDEQKARIRAIQDEQEDNGVEPGEAEVEVKGKGTRKVVVIEGSDDEITELLTTLGYEIDGDDYDDEDADDKGKGKGKNDEPDPDDLDIPDDDDNNDPPPPPAHRYYRGRKRG